MQYGLIGEKLGHSYSPEIHTAIGGYEYELKEIAPGDLAAFIKARRFKGINITIPYKQDVLPLADLVDERAARIGAVNTLVNRDGKLYAYNTDYEGVVYTLRHNRIALKGKTVLLLGSGGTARTLRAVAEDEGAAEILTASRTAGTDTISYSEAMERQDVAIAINCSPAGMYPHNGGKLVDLAKYPRLEAVMDAVYNPFKTALLLQAEDLGVKAVNGLEMLVAQGARAAGLFCGREVNDGEIATIHKSIYKRLCNIALVGMPGCGKTSLGRALAKELGKTFVDLDECIEREAGMGIPDIFAQRGEAEFRRLEREITARYGAENGQVLSTGGGVVKDRANVDALRQNGPVLFVDCPVEKLAMSDGRPLAKSRADLESLHSERHGLYTAAADVRVEYHPYFPENLRRLLEAFGAL